MMLSLPVGLSVLSLSLLQSPASSPPIDVSLVKVGAPIVVAEIDLGKLKGELRQLAWSPDGTQLYVQTGEGNSSSGKLHDYAMPLAGGAPVPLTQKPDWADAYWAFKSDRFAPGIGSLFIDVEQKYETMKFGTGSAGAADRASDPTGGNNVNVASNVEKAAESQREHVVRLTLVGETISEFVNQPPVPGLMFSWGPVGSGAIAFTDRDGRLFLLDQKKHKQSVAGAKDALLPAWTMDGSRLAWAQKSGRRKYTLVYAPVGYR